MIKKIKRVIDIIVAYLRKTWVLLSIKLAISLGVKRGLVEKRLVLLILDTLEDIVVSLSGDEHDIIDAIKDALDEELRKILSDEETKMALDLSSYLLEYILRLAGYQTIIEPDEKKAIIRVLEDLKKIIGEK